MSSLIFLTTPEFAFVATDTLALSADDGRPLKFCTKAFPVPHLRMIVGCTGIAQFGLNWYLQVNDKVVVHDVDNLDYHTPEALRKSWADFQVQFPAPHGQRVTIYHFGFAISDGSIHSYAYRSTNDFKSESIIYGLGIKPPVDQPEQYQVPQDLRKIMDIQRAAELARPPEERIGIGGEIQTLFLDKQGFTIATTDKFDDYDSDEEIIFSRFNQ